MKIINTFDQNELNSIDNALIQECQKGKSTDWNRTFFLRNPADGKTALISLNLFERIVSELQRIFCCRQGKLESVFNTKNFKIIAPSDLKQAEKKVNDQAKVFINLPAKENEINNLNQDNVDIKNKDASLKVVEQPLVDKKPEEEVKPPADKPQDVILPEPEKKNDIQNEPILENKPVLDPKNNEIKPPADKQQDVIPPKPENPIAIQNLIPRIEQILSPDQIVQNYLQAGNLEEAIKANKKLSYLDRKDNWCKIAKAYFQQDNIEKAIEILDKEIINSDITKPIYKEFALSCCQKGKYDESKKLIRKISYEDKIICNIFLEVAEEFYQKDEYEKALEVINQIIDLKPSICEDFYLKLGANYIDKDELEKAAEILNKVIYKNNESEGLLAKLVYRYLAKDDLENALQYIQFNNDYKSVKELYIQIANVYQNRGDKAQALNVLHKIAKHGYLVDVAHSGMVNKYLDEGNFDGALEGIERSSIRKTLW